MPEKRIEIALPPGFYNTGADYAARRRWTEGNFVRFFEGSIQPIGGWVARTPTGDAVSGEVRGACQWTPEIIGAAQQPILAFGTTAGLFVLVADTIYDITPTGIGTNNNRIWTLEPFGSYLIATAHDPTNYTGTRGPFLWTGDISANATAIAGAPASPTSVVATDERFLLQLGGADPYGDSYDVNFPTRPSPRTVLWPSQETYDDWTPTAENSAGSFPLATSGKLLAGRRSKGTTLLFTTTDLFTCTFIGGEFVFSFARVGEQCGAISIGSPVMVDGVAYWMGPNGFFAFDGFVRPIPCEVHDYVFQNLNRDAASLIWGFANPAYGEVTWFYPRGAATRPSHYVTYSYRDKHFVFGELQRSAGVPEQPPGTVPVLLDADGIVYDHETGTSRSTTTSAFLKSGPVELGDGDQVVHVKALIPSEKTLGDVQARFFTRFEPMGAETAHGPYSLEDRTDVRVTGRLIRMEFEEAETANWRIGPLKLLVTPGGRR